MISGYFSTYMPCLRCGVVQRMGVQTPLVDDAMATLGLGASVPAEDLELAGDYLVGAPITDRIVILDHFQLGCAACRVQQWIEIHVQGTTIHSAESVRLDIETLRRANYISRDIDEHFENVTGESIYRGSEVRDDWYPRLLRALPLWTSRLERTIPQLGRADDDPGGFLDAVMKMTSLGYIADGETLVERAGVNVMRGTGDAPVVPPLPEDEDTVSIKLSTWRNSNWPAWRVIGHDVLLSILAQAEVAAGRPIAVPHALLDFPLGATADGGRWTLVGCLRGSGDRGSYLAMTRDRTFALATLRRRSNERTAFAAAGGDRVAPLIWQGTLDGAASLYEAIIEAQPVGDPLKRNWLPMHPVGLLTLGGSLATLLDESYRDGRAIGGLRPETIYADDELRITGLVPRGEAFMRGVKPGSVGSVLPYTYLYDAPEVLRGGDATPASDVFAACAVIAHLAAGEHPFEGEGAFAQLQAISGGKRRPFRGPAQIARIVDRGLVADPEKRPTAAELAEMFGAVSGR